MCNADDTPRYSTESDRPESGVGQVRMCRSWEKLEDWARVYDSCYAYVNQTSEDLQELQRFIYCPSGSPWRESVVEVFGKEVPTYEMLYDLWFLTETLFWDWLQIDLWLRSCFVQFIYSSSIKFQYIFCFYQPLRQSKFPTILLNTLKTQICFWKWSDSLEHEDYFAKRRFAQDYWKQGLDNEFQTLHLHQEKLYLRSRVSINENSDREHIFCVVREVT